MFVGAKPGRNFQARALVRLAGADLTRRTFAARRSARISRARRWKIKASGASLVFLHVGKPRPATPT